MAKDITFKQLLRYWPLYFFVLPSALLVATFSYFPAASAIYHSVFRWDGNYIKIFVGSSNFQRALGSPMYWVLTLVLSMLMIYQSQKTGWLSNVTKWVCGFGFPLINLFWVGPRYGFPDLSVWGGMPPLFFWGLLWSLAIWKLDPDSEFKALTHFFFGFFGLGAVLNGMGLNPNLSWSLSAIAAGLGLWGLPRSGRKVHKLAGLRITQALIGMGVMVWSLAQHAGGQSALWGGFGVISVLVVANLVKMVPSIATAVVIHRLKSDSANYWYRVLFVVPMIIPGMVGLLIWKFFFESGGLFNLILRRSGIMHLLYLIDAKLGNEVFISSDQAAIMSISDIFAAASEATPAWLGNPDLVLPAFIVWGFPWVGVVGVLIYLAGLQNIDQSVYEAADLDGVGAFGKFLNIELPLILTQVRINLVLMIIGTLQMYGQILILFGDGGGPNGRMNVPGLLMYRSAFVEGYAGYACAIGLILFFLILVLTEINNRFVRVDK